MIDSACNYLNPYATVSLTATTQMPGPSIASSTAGSGGNEFRSVPTVASAASMYDKTIGCSSNMKMEMQYPPQTSSTGSVSPNSSTQSTPSSASVSPSIFPSPAQSFASISSSPPSSATSASPLSGSHSELGAAAAASAAYSWNTAAYTAALPTRTQFPYAQYASDYYGNVGMSAASAGAWFSHQDRLYQPWSGQTYPSFNFDDIAFQTQLQRRSVRCTCPNCTNEMSGLPPIVGPDERGRKQHICHIPGCERLYGKASHLKTHLRWHTGERPFLCLTCGKRFSRSDELQRHGRTHTNYRPYACPICSKKFSRSDHLSKHKKTHFKDKKSKKSQVAEVKTQGAAVKQEKSNNAGENLEKSSPIKSSTTLAPPIAMSTSTITKTVATATTRPSGTALGTQQDVPQLQLKTEQPDPPAGYTPYTNLYHHQSSALFQPHMSSNSSYGIRSAVQQTTAAPPTFDLWNSHHHHHHNRSTIEQQQQEHHQSQHQLLPSANSTHSGIMTNTSNNLHQPQTQQQQQQAQLPSQHQSQSQSQTSRLSSSPVATSSGSNMSQHYAALTMQSETQLAAEYGLTMSSTNGVIGCPPTSTPVIHPHPHSHTHVQHPATYSGLIGQMKTEYPTYPEFPTNSYSTSGSSAFHHHAHNPWTSTAAYQQSHATA